MHAYPSAKVILTNREPDSWHASVSRTVLQSRRYWLHGVLQHLDWATGFVHPMRIKFWQCLFDDDFEKNGREAMAHHYAEVRSCARMQGRGVLEMQLGDGWEPLCEILGVKIPHEPYPTENASDGFIPKMKERARLRLRAVALRWAKIASTVAVVGVLARLLAPWQSEEHVTLSSWLRRLVGKIDSERNSW